MPYWRLYYHLVWSTKNRLPLLTPEVEPIVHRYLREKAAHLEGFVHALNGVEDHVHMLVAIPPKIAVAKFVGQIKAATSTRFNKEGHADDFFWQSEYGVFSFDRKRLPNFVAYVERQKQYHADGTTIPILERTEQSTENSIQEKEVVYQIELRSWRDEVMQLSEGIGD